MHLLFRFSLIAALGLFLVLSTAEVQAQEPGWTSRVLKLGSEREISEQTPILERPYRPLHFYGNAVRRNHYRGNPLPMPRDILITGAFLAPSSRERDSEREQRLGGFDYRLSADDAADKEKQDDAAAEQSDAEQAPAEQPPVDQPESEETADEPAQVDAATSSGNESARQSSRRNTLDAQARRNRRGN